MNWLYVHVAFWSVICIAGSIRLQKYLTHRRTERVFPAKCMDRLWTTLRLLPVATATPTDEERRKRNHDLRWAVTQLLSLHVDLRCSPPPAIPPEVIDQIADIGRQLDNLLPLPESPDIGGRALAINDLFYELYRLRTRSAVPEGTYPNSLANRFSVKSCSIQILRSQRVN
ncbi:hypothetical protein [Gimesia maris]|uniref:hypothetical protein n=1 Tax=Gimesia maris TaxID=122 RepID=UPI0032EB79C2